MPTRHGGINSSENHIRNHFKKNCKEKLSAKISISSNLNIKYNSCYVCLNFCVVNWSEMKERPGRGPGRVENNTWGAAEGVFHPLKSARVGLNKLAGTYNIGPTIIFNFQCFTCMVKK